MQGLTFYIRLTSFTLTSFFYETDFKLNNNDEI